MNLLFLPFIIVICFSCSESSPIAGKEERKVVFARQANDSILRFKQETRLYLNGISMPDGPDRIPTINIYNEKGTKTFEVTQAKLTMKNEGQSWNDADFIKVTLQYAEGLIEFNKLINASYFEHDMDKDGIKEQYLFGTRNCTQEIVILRINNPTK